MGKAIDNGHEAAAHPHARNWPKAMSDNIAFALIVYTGLQIFVTVHALKEGSSTILPYFALIILVAAIIPACRWFEKRWKDMGADAACDESLRSAFRRDQLMLWVLAIGLPFLLTGLLKAFFSATA